MVNNRNIGGFLVLASALIVFCVIKPTLCSSHTLFWKVLTCVVQLACRLKKLLVIFYKMCLAT